MGILYFGIVSSVEIDDVHGTQFEKLAVNCKCIFVGSRKAWSAAEATHEFKTKPQIRLVHALSQETSGVNLN